MNSFLFPTPERHYTKVLNFITDIGGLKYFRTVARAQAASYSKKNMFFLN